MAMSMNAFARRESIELVLPPSMPGWKYLFQASTRHDDPSGAFHAKGEQVRRLNG